MEVNKNELAWMIVAAGAAALAGSIVQRGLNSGWNAVMHEDPPNVKELPVKPWRVAFAYTLASGIAVGMARLLSQRGAAMGWEKITGEPPMKKVT